MEEPKIRLVCPHCGCSDADLEEQLWTDTSIHVVCTCCSKTYTVLLSTPNAEDERNARGTHR